MAANMRTLAVYGRARDMGDPALRARLADVRVPVLVVWGESDRVVTPAYGRAVAASFPEARLEILAECGHMPQIEQPARLLALVATMPCSRSWRALPNFHVALQHGSHTIAALHHQLETDMTTAFAFPSFPGADKFTPEAFQANRCARSSNSAQAWADLGKKHFEESRLATEAALKSVMGIKDPHAAVELYQGQRATRPHAGQRAAARLRRPGRLAVPRHRRRDRRQAAAARRLRADRQGPEVRRRFRAHVAVDRVDQVAPAAKKATRSA